ncbi:MAG: IclR family transcriptional regulator [Chloroflexi bacterium]|nr:IclR family transcriptional regulator [Chloroflexota bacterium]
MPEAEAQVPSGRGGPGLLQRAFLAIEALADGPRAAADIARLLDVNRSTALRLMEELVATGYVQRDARTKRYANVTTRFYALVANNDDHADWSDVVDPLLADLRDEFGEAGIMGVPANGAMVYLAFFPSAHLVAVRERLGTTRPMHCSALGKAYLAALSAHTLDAELALLTFRGGTQLAARGPIELSERLGVARVRGYAIDRNETFDGGTCVAAPVRIGRSLVGAVGLSGPSSRFDDDRIRTIGERLVEVTRRLGGHER